MKKFLRFSVIGGYGIMIVEGITVPEWVTFLMVGAGAIALADVADHLILNLLIERI
jgi:hypothetical protein